MDKKYETDLTRREKWELEKEKIKSLHGSERAEYIWSYYKMYFIFAVLAVIIIVTAVQAFMRLQVKKELSVVIIDSTGESNEKREKLEKEITELICGKDKNKKVEFDMTLSSANDYTLSVKLDTLIASKSADIIICDEKTFKKLEAQDIFLDWKEVLGAEYGSFEKNVSGTAMHIDGSSKLKDSGMIPYSPVYMGAVGNTEHRENIIRLAEFFSE